MSLYADGIIVRDHPWAFRVAVPQWCVHDIILCKRKGIPCLTIFSCSLRRSIMFHYNDVIMSAIAYQITSLTIVYSTVNSGADQRKHKKHRVTGLCAGNSPVTGEFPAQKASNVENVSIRWRHHELDIRQSPDVTTLASDALLKLWHVI